MKNFIYLFAVFITFSITVLGYDKVRDSESKVKNSVSEEKILNLSDYINHRQRYLNTKVQVRGRFFLPEPCPICPAGVLCKPCFNQYFVLESLDKKFKVSINIKSDSKILQNVKNEQEITISITYLGDNRNGINSQFGFFEFEGDVDLNKY